MRTCVIITAMICITALEVVALINGIDGTMFGVVIAALAGLGGYEIKSLSNRRRED